jgi:hypothetical protein
MKTLKNYFLIALVAFSVVFTSCEKDESTPDTPVNPPVVVDPVDPVGNLRTYVNEFTFDSVKKMVLFPVDEYEVDSIYLIQSDNDTIFVKPLATTQKITLKSGSNLWKFTEITNVEKMSTQLKSTSSTDDTYVMSGDFITATNDEVSTVSVKVNSNGTSTVESFDGVQLDEYMNGNYVMSPDNKVNYTEDFRVKSVTFTTNPNSFSSGVVNLNKAEFESLIIANNVAINNTHHTEIMNSSNISELQSTRFFHNSVGAVYAIVAFKNPTDGYKEVFFMIQINISGSNVTPVFLHTVLNYADYFAHSNLQPENINNTEFVNSNLVMGYNYEGSLTETTPGYRFYPNFVTYNKANNTINIIRFHIDQSSKYEPNRLKIEKYMVFGNYMYVFIHSEFPTDAVYFTDRILKIELSSLTNDNLLIEFDLYQNNNWKLFDGTVSSITTSPDKSYVIMNTSDGYKKLTQSGELTNYVVTDVVDINGAVTF